MSHEALSVNSHSVWPANRPEQLLTAPALSPRGKGSVLTRTSSSGYPPAGRQRSRSASLAAVSSLENLPPPPAVQVRRVALTVEGLSNPREDKAYVSNWAAASPGLLAVACA